MQCDVTKDEINAELVGADLKLLGLLGVGGLKGN